MSMDEKNNNSSIVGQTTNVQSFGSPQEEIAFLRSKLEETQTEFNEFQESSRELEVEYETQVKQLEKKNIDLENYVNKLEIENNQIKQKYNIYTNDTQHKLNEFQQQIAELTAMNNRLSGYIRELEQNNDDLERARRTLAASLEDFEGQLNQQIEKNVLLENEVSEKEELECVVQRLKEETRDLKHELIAKTSLNDPSKRILVINNSVNNGQQDKTSLSSQSSPTQLAHVNSTEASNQSTCSTSSSDTNKRPPMVDSTTSPPPRSPLSRFSFTSPFSGSSNNNSQISSDSSTSKSTESKSQQTSAPTSPKQVLPQAAMVMSPTSRISALNIVSDLLRKVGALESKLTSAKKVASNNSTSQQSTPGLE